MGYCAWQRGEFITEAIHTLAANIAATSPMRFRKLRIAWSVAWGLAAVLLIVLWVRSYQYPPAPSPVEEFPPAALGGNVAVSFAHGMIYITLMTKEPHPSLERKISVGEFTWASSSPLSFFATVPFWMPAVLSLTTGIAPWIHWSSRFSIRTLLIATTLVAVVLGLIVWPR
jgi:hypothetical protein